MGEDMMLGLGHLTRWDRITVVSDVEWLRTAVAAFRPFMPCPVRSFVSADREAAKKWLTETVA